MGQSGVRAVAAPAAQSMNGNASTPSRPPPARLLIVDDHELARASLRLLLTGEPDLAIIGEAANGQEALDLCRALQADLVLMDLRIPIMDGITATRLIRQACPETRVLLLTVAESPEQLEQAKQAGAVGILLKEASREELVTAIHRVMTGKRLFE